MSGAALVDNNKAVQDVKPTRAPDGRTDERPPGGVVIKVLSEHLLEAGVPAWLVGGTVRDHELGRPSPDVDLVVACDQERLHGLCVLLARRLGLARFTLSTQFGAERVVFAGGHLDVSPLRGRSIEEDLSLRDFTINAMARPLGGGALVDPFGGLHDLRARLVRAVSDHAFRDDPVRLLRAVRLAQTLGLTISPETAAWARRDAPLLVGAAPERLLLEIAATLSTAPASAAVRLWDHLDILAQVFPEVAALKGVGQSTNHHRDVFGHTLEALDHLDSLMADASWLFPDSAAELARRLAVPVDGSVSRPAALRLAVLLHDIAKPETRHIDGQGRLSFWGHEEKGVPKARAVCERLRTSRAVVSLVSRIVEGHLWLGFLQNRKPLWDTDEVEYLWRAHPWEAELVLASVADRLATRGPMTAPRFVWRHLTLARDLLFRWVSREREGTRPLPVRGDELAAALGMAQGPALGGLLRQLRLEWEAGELPPEKTAILERARELLAEGVVS